MESKEPRHDLSCIVLVDKPQGITSFGITAWLRRLYKGAKVGHAGTLDPMATGLMLVGITRKGTRALGTLVKLDKTYEVGATFGVATDTGDADGDVTTAVEPAMARAALESSDMRSTIESLVGINPLAVPLYSSIKHNGVSLHRRVRRGQKVEAPTRDMKVYAARFESGALDSSDYPTVRFVVDVASGVYVRSLVEELGRRLGLPAHTHSLRRTKVGEFRIEDAAHPDDVPARYSHVEFD